MKGAEEGAEGFTMFVGAGMRGTRKMTMTRVEGSAEGGEFGDESMSERIRGALKRVGRVW